MIRFSRINFRGSCKSTKTAKFIVLEKSRNTVSEMLTTFSITSNITINNIPWYMFYLTFTIFDDYILNLVSCVSSEILKPLIGPYIYLLESRNQTIILNSNIIYSKLNICCTWETFSMGKT